jgi:predicted phosphodiesterase
MAASVRSWRARDWVATVAIGLLGGALGLLLAGRIRYPLGPFEVELFARPGLGQTEIALPPLGTIRADTHDVPIHLSATLESVDPDRADAAIRARGFSSLVQDVEREGLASVRVYAVRALGLAFLGALVLGLLVHRRRWERVIAAASAGALIIGSLGAVAWTTYRPRAFLEPTYTGSLTLAPDLIGPVREATGRIEDFRAELDRLLRGAVRAYGSLAVGEGPSPDAVTVLHISDVHASPLGMDFAQRLAESFEVGFVIDTGDITSFGSPLERAILARVPAFRVPYVFIRGNHDDPEVGTSIEAYDNAEVLENEAVTLEGITVYGAPHPLYTPDPGFDLSDQEIGAALEEAGLDLVATLAGESPSPDVLAVHDDRMALPAAGQVPVVVSGHFHRFAAAVNEGSLFLRTGSTGGGGLDTFSADEPFPLSAELLFFEGPERELVAIDRITLDPETRDLTVERQLATTLLAEEPVPAPTASPDQ